jgi:hypothetical protein
LLDPCDWPKKAEAADPERITQRKEGMEIPMLLVVIAAALSVAPMMQVPAVVNPARLSFTCPDHDQDNQHEIDIINVSTGAVESTILGGDPAANAAGEVVIVLNIQPIKFGEKRFVVRAVAGTEKSESSAPSDVWRRSPGTPGKATVIK